MHPRLQSGAPVRPLNFTVRRRKRGAVACQRTGHLLTDSEPFNMVEHWSSESLDAANGSPAEPPISDAELTALALKDPPPDDFRGSGTKQESPLSERSGAPIFWLVALLVIGLLGALFLYIPKIQSHESHGRPRRMAWATPSLWKSFWTPQVPTVIGCACSAPVESRSRRSTAGRLRFSAG